MSIIAKQNEVTRYQKSIVDSQKKLADELKKEASKADEINRIERSITKSTSVNTVHSKKQQITRAMSAIASIQKKKAELNKKIADDNTKLHRAQQNLSKAQEAEQKKIHSLDKKREKEQLIHQQAITRELRTQHNYKSNNDRISSRDVKYDAFVSHATEDKEEFVKPLVEALQSAGYSIWYDEFTLKVGDSLRRSIDDGLKNSKYGIVVFSKAFFEKNWTQYELDGLLTKEMDGHKVLLPIWHMVSKNQVQQYSPSLADKVAINSSLSTVDEIVVQLSEVFIENNRIS